VFAAKLSRDIMSVAELDVTTVFAAELSLDVIAVSAAEVSLVTTTSAQELSCPVNSVCGRTVLT
jgi:hypothetical protein